MKIERRKITPQNTQIQCLPQLILLILLFGMSQQLISQGQTTFDGVTQDLLPSYYSLDGTNGLEAVLDNRNINQTLDYFVRIWVRTKSNYDQNNGQKNETIFDIPNSLQCAFLFNKSLACSSVNMINVTIPKNATSNISMIIRSAQTLTLPLGDLQPQAWIHIAIGGSVSQNISYIRVDYQDQMLATINSSYLFLQQQTYAWFAYLGSRNSLKPGFIGDVREFLIANSYVDWKQVSIVKNQLIYWDTSLLGNYRLQAGNLNDSFRTNMTINLLSTVQNQVPTWKYENLPNDICYPQFQTSQILRVNSSNLYPSLGSIDSRMSTSISNFQYTASFWIRTLPGIETSQQFSLSSSIFYLQQVFSLWFTDPLSLKIFIHSTKVQTNNQTAPIFIPSNQWANLQFALDRTTGYEVRVYDIQRRLLFRINQTMTFQAQSPTRQFSLFGNYQGYMKSIMIYQTKKPLPLDQSYGDLKSIKDDTLILYYKFGKNNFQQQSLSSLVQVTNGSYGASVLFQGSLEFDNVEWIEDLNYTNPSYQATLSQSDKFYDGLACNDSNLLYTTNSQSSYIGYSMQNTGENLNQATVELWYKRDSSPSSLAYLFSMYSVAQKKEYFGIFQRAGESQIVCKPFDSRNPSNLIEVRTQTQTSSNQAMWQHIACKFMYGSDVSVTQHNNQAPGQYFKTSLRGQNYFIPQDSYYLIIGNSYQQNFGQANNQYKEVRFWKESRSDLLIESYLYRQIDPSREVKLFTYFRLLSGNSFITNYIGLQSNITADQNDISNKPATALNLVCPLSSYIFNQGNFCVRNPYINQRLLALPTYNASANQSLSFQITSNFSDKYYTGLLDNLQYTWKASGLQLSNSQITSETLTLQNSITAPMNKTFSVSQQINSQSKSFFTENQISLSLNPCSFVTDIQSMKSLNYQFLTSNPGDNDLTFSFAESKIPSCGLWNTTNISLQSNIQISVYPSFLNIQASNSYTFNSTTNSFNFILPKSEQAKIGKYQEVYIVATIYWNMSDKNTTNPSFIPYQTSQNLVYVVKFIDEIIPTINLSPYKMVLVDQTLILDANQSYFPSMANTLNQNGISYAWICPQQFQQICQSQTNSALLRITYQDFITYVNDFTQMFNFTLVTWKSSEPASSGNFSTSTIISWINAQIPQFQISIVNSNTVIASQANTFNLNLKNYDINDPNLDVSWTLKSLSANSLPIPLTLSNFKTYATLAKNALSANQNYQLTVTVTNSSQPLANKTQTFNFSTGGGSGPYGGTYSVAPFVGNSFSTLFTITISGWMSPNQTNIKYRVFSYYNQMANPVIITSRFYYQNESVTSYLMPASYLVIEISDDSGITQTVQQSVTINVYDFVSQVQGAIKSQTSDQLQNSLWQVAQYVLSDNLWQLPLQQTLEIRTMILNYLESQSSMFTLVNDELSDNSVNFVSQSMKILNLITNNTISINDTIALQALKVLQQITLRKQALKYNMNQQDFQQNYASAISNLQAFANQRQVQLIASNSLRRMLQSVHESSSIDGLLAFTTTAQMLEYIDQLLKEKDAYAQYFCDSLSSSDPSESSVQYTISTDSYQLIMEKIPSTSRVVNRTYMRLTDQSFSQIPISLILQTQAQTNLGQSQDICIQVTMFNFNPLQGYTFENQDFKNPSPVIQISTQNALIDNSEEPIQSQYSIMLNQFYFDFNNNNYNFKNNQTTCLQIQRNQVSYTNQSWSFDNCQTSYNVNSNSINCRCSQLGQQYYAIGNDYTRTLVVADTTSTVQQQKSLYEIAMDFDSSVVAILILLILMIIIMPIVAICLDKKDYELLKSEDCDISQEFLKRIAMKKQMPFEIVLYNKIRYLRYIDIDQLGFCTLFRIFTLELHPFFNIFAKFDIELKRLVRYMVFSFQVSIIAIICALVFGKTYREEDQDDAARDDDADDTDKSNAVLAGFCLALLTLPLAELFTNCFKATLVLENNEQSQNSLATPKSKKKIDNEADLKNEIQRQKNKKQNQDKNNIHNKKTGEKNFDNIHDMEEGSRGIQNTQSRLKHAVKEKEERYKDGGMVDVDNLSATNLDMSKIDEPVVSVDRCIPCKLILIILSFIIAILAMIAVSLESGDNIKANSICMVIAFFIAILIGNFVYNFIKIFLITVYTPQIVQDEIKSDGHLKGGLSLINCLLIPTEAKIIMKDMMLIYDMGDENQQDEEQDENSDNPHQKTNEEEVRKHINNRIIKNPQSALKSNQNNGPSGSGQSDGPGSESSDMRMADKKKAVEQSQEDDDDDPDHEMSSIIANRLPQKKLGRDRDQRYEAESSQSFEDKIEKDLSNL